MRASHSPSTHGPPSQLTSDRDIMRAMSRRKEERVSGRRSKLSARLTRKRFGSRANPTWVRQFFSAFRGIRLVHGLRRTRNRLMPCPPDHQARRNNKKGPVGQGRDFLPNRPCYRTALAQRVRAVTAMRQSPKPTTCGARSTCCAFLDRPTRGTRRKPSSHVEGIFPPTAINRFLDRR